MFVSWDCQSATFTCRIKRFISHAEAKVFDKVHRFTEIVHCHWTFLLAGQAEHKLDVKK